jgi:hypothetical protein
MTTPPTSAMHEPYVAKELAIGFLTDQNSEIGLTRKIQNISGVTGFVCGSLLSTVVTILYTILTFYWFKAGCGKTVLMYGAL